MLQSSFFFRQFLILKSRKDKYVNIVEDARQNDPKGEFSDTPLKNRKEVHTTKRAAVETPRRYIAMVAMLGVCTLPVWRENPLGKPSDRV